MEPCHPNLSPKLGTQVRFHLHQERNTMQTIIPFQGFYCSAHDHLIDNAVDSMSQDDLGDPIPERVEQISCKAKWSKVHQEYSKRYVEMLCEEYNIQLKFVELDSPREYNFTTDKIVCEISEAEVKRIFDEVDAEELTRVAEERHTSRSGFISFYNPDWKTWGTPDTWEAQQLCTLLTAYIGEFDEYDLMCELNVEDLIWDAMPVGFEFSA